MVTLATGTPRKDQMLGVQLHGGERRWLRVSTAADRPTDQGPVRYVVSCMTDETDSHAARLAASQDGDTKRRRVRAVLDGGGPRIVVQPIIDLDTGEVVGAEALSRFDGRPTQGPDQWFADAAQVGLGAELELAAVVVALPMLAALPPHAYLSVNVSPETASSAALLDLLRDSAVPTDRVVLELTEHADVGDYPALDAALRRLRALGVRIAVDDAGTGFASLRHILNLRPDIVKLDLALVRGIHADPARRALAAGLLVFTQQIGACLVAEGIEAPDELAALRQVGVTHGQGYHLGRPTALPIPTIPPQERRIPSGHRRQRRCPERR